MRWVVLALLLLWTPLRAQTLINYPRVTSVSSVTIVEEFLYFDLLPLAPQQNFRDWWDEVEACSGVRKPFDGVTWYVADVIYNFDERREAFGIYYESPPEIVIAHHRSMPELEDTVKHEILHHLGFMGPDHNEAVFNRCLLLKQKH